MGYNWEGAFGSTGGSDQTMITPNNDFQEDTDRDKLQAQLDQQTLAQRNQYDAQGTATDFQNQMQYLKTSKEYELANMRERAALEAQLIALQKGDLTWRASNGLASGGEFDAGGMDVVDILSSAGGMAAGVGAYKNRAAISSGLGKAGQMIGDAGSFGNIANKGLQAGSAGLKQGTASALNYLNPKVTNPIFNKILQGAGKGGMDASIGMANLGKKVAGKGSTKVVSKLLGGLAGKSAGKIGGALVGGVPGFIIGSIAGEALGKMLESNNDDERAKAQFMISNFK